MRELGSLEYVIEANLSVEGWAVGKSPWFGHRVVPNQDGGPLPHHALNRADVSFRFGIVFRLEHGASS